MATKDIHKVYKITQASMVKIEADTADAVIKSINTPKFKKHFNKIPFLPTFVIILAIFSKAS